jgi:UrcA family protein
MRFLAALLFAALVAQPAAAEPRRELTLTRVFVGDLDLATDAGAARMFRRLKVAVREVCEAPVSPLLPTAEARAWRCRREAMGAVVERLKSPRLDLAYAEWLSADPDAQAPSPLIR